MIGKALFTSNSEEWATPQDFFDKLDAEFHFTLDACATPENAKCEKYFTKEQNGLEQDWTGETVFCNPPYGRKVGAWCEKCYKHSQNGGVAVMLIHARTDTKWFHDWVYGKAEMRFVRGRLKFGDGKQSAPFPSLVAVYGRMNNDLISRQAAIDAMAEAYEDTDAEWILRRLPSAQPEPCEDAVHAAYKHGKSKGIKKGLRMLKDAQPEQRWIPCNEKLPKPNANVLVTLIDRRRRKKDANWNGEKRYSIRIDKIVDYEGDMSHPFWAKGNTPSVIAWMPLPEPYKEDVNEDD